MMDRLKLYFEGQGFKRLTALALIALILYLMRSMINLLLLTFIFTFLMYQLQKHLVAYINRYVKINKKMVISALYAALIGGLVFTFYRYLPIVVREVDSLVRQLMAIYNTPQHNPILRYIVESTQDLNVEKSMEQTVDILIQSAAGIGSWSINILLAILLSFFFLLEKNKIAAFTTKFRTSRMASIYSELEYFAKKFIESFGKVIETQIIIATINSVLSTMILWLMGFPSVLGLGIMIFFMGLIPVAGVIISLVPLCMIAMNIGGLVKVFYVLLMIVLLHALEAYVLNPKIMSEKVNLPVFYTFIILIVSEHLMGVWGLIIGVPIFIFILDLLDVKAEKGGH